MKKHQEKKLSTQFQIGRYSCHMSFDLETGELVSLWHPHKPSFSQRELRDYQDERNAFFEQAAEALDGKLVIVGKESKTQPKKANKEEHPLRDIAMRRGRAG